MIDLRSKRSSRLGRSCILVSLFALVAVFMCAGSAFADSASLSVTNTAGASDPAAHLPRVFTVSGDTEAPEHVFIKYRSPGGAPCASSAYTDTGSWFENYSIYGDVSVNGAFSYSNAATWREPGTFVFCIWIAESENAIVATPITQTITFRSPTGGITATVNPVTPEPGQKATITITGSSEAPERVFAKIQPVGGTGCAPTYEADSGSNLLEAENVNGSFSEQATTTQSKAGQYLICLWLAESRSDTSPVAGPQPETFTVASPPPPPPPPPPAPSAQCLRDRGGVAHGEILIRRYEGKLRARHLSRRTRRTDSRALAAARISASKYEGLRRHECPNGK